MKIRPVGPELFHADGRTGWRTDGQTNGRADGRTDRETDMRKLTVAFRDFTNAPKNENTWKTIGDKVINLTE